FEEPSVLGELHDPRVRIPTMSVGDENGPVGSDDDGATWSESILARAGESGLAKRHQNLSLWAEFENLLARAVFALAVSSPHVSVLVHRETVRKDKHSCAKAVHEPAGRIELENGRQLRAGARVSATSVKSPDIASTVNRDPNDGAELPSLGKLRPVLHQVIGIGLRASGASGNRHDRDECDQQNDSHSICIWLHSPSFCQKLERDSSARSRENYFNWSCTLAMPALAQASSMGWPPGAPLKPTEPIASSPIMIGTPPPSGITSARLRWPVKIGRAHV